jgi:hypothetical protein
MNVIGIVQTDLNEFNILFDKQQQTQQNGNQTGGQPNQQNQTNDDTSFFNLLGDDGSGNQASGGNYNQGQQSGPQEMTVRIKGIPEGQKATFLQMYQIIEDAREERDLESKLTIVSRGDNEQQQQQQQQQQ